MSNKRPDFAEMCQQYPHRYTMEHIPQWVIASNAPGATRSSQYHVDGRRVYYAPVYASDREWYDNTLFPGEAGYIGDGSACFSTGATFPLGRYLSGPYKIGQHGPRYRMYVDQGKRGCHDVDDLAELSPLMASIDGWERLVIVRIHSSK